MPELMKQKMPQGVTHSSSSFKAVILTLLVPTFSPVSMLRVLCFQWLLLTRLAHCMSQLLLCHAAAFCASQSSSTVLLCCYLGCTLSIGQLPVKELSRLACGACAASSAVH